ncbi:MAG TPA: photosystem I reaction center subunit IX, partial [Nevskiaceae bacterium]|nr:photosystem I reaction center subunit IX [Nevskiaceae bacterium]
MRLPLGITTVLASLVAGLAVASLQTAAPKAAELSAIRTGIPHEALFSAAIQGNDGLAVGAGGSILSSADGGLTWTPEKAPTELSLLGVGMGGRHRVAVGQMGVILVKEDAGWVSVDSGTQERLMAVDVHASGLVVVAGSFGA